MSNQQFLSTYTSFSGADLLVSFGPKVIGELQQISYAVQREKVPVFTLGSPNPRSFSRGKRGIAGSLVIATFDRDALLETMKEMWSSIAPAAMFTAAGNIAAARNENFTNALNLTAWNQKNTDSAIAVYGNNVAYGSSGTTAITAQADANPSNAAALPAENNSGKIILPPGFNTITSDRLQYADQVPPFDVTLTFANEYGQTAFMKIYDLELLNESSGVSVDSVVLEKAYTWIARNISPVFKGVYQRDNSGGITGLNPLTGANNY
jgi:hypothetical protein